jgi:UDP-N-acetylmuramyl pentapeptide synthase
MRPDAVVTCRSAEESLAAVRKIFPEQPPGAWVLIKGSRGMRMEEISLALTGRRASV